MGEKNNMKIYHDPLTLSREKEKRRGLQPRRCELEGVPSLRRNERPWGLWWFFVEEPNDGHPIAIGFVRAENMTLETETGVPASWSRTEVGPLQWFASLELSTEYRLEARVIRVSVHAFDHDFS